MMPFEFITEYPLWLIIFCFGAAAILTYLLYRKRQFRHEGRLQWPYVIMATCRFLGLLLLSFLLLSPLIRYVMRSVQKPVVAVAVDNSESLLVCSDSVFYRNQLPGILEKFSTELEDDYEVKFFSFGHELREKYRQDFSDRQTDISSVFKGLNGLYDNRNLGAVVLLSDGIYNKGSNPVYSLGGIKAPIFTVGMGDTSVRRDVLIPDVKYNRLVYLDNSFPLAISVDALKCQGEKVTLNISEDGKHLFNRQIDIGEKTYHTLVTAMLNAEKPGMHHYVVSVSGLGNEVSYVNNRKDVFVEVLDARQKIILLASSPHPDLAAYRQAVESNNNYEVKVVFTDDFNTADLKGCDLVISHQLPVTQQDLLVMKKTDELNISSLHIIGNQTNLSLLSQYGAGFQISGNRSNANEAYAVAEAGFSLFSLGQGTQQRMSLLPPMQCPYGKYQITVPYTTLASQQVGNVKTAIPLIFFTGAETRSGWVCGEGFWKWRLYDFEAGQNHDATNELVSKMVQYLAVKTDKRRFRVTQPKNAFYENERISFDAELYNESYELVNKPDVNLVVSGPGGKNFNFVFSRTAAAYTLDAGLLPEGAYTYSAKVLYNGKTETVSGKFSVMPLQVELNETVADHQLLFNLAARNNGSFIEVKQLDKLAEQIRKRDDIKPVIYSEKNLRDLVNLKWYFFLMCGLFTLEWVLRKREGSY